jgi:hypothetical protein
LLPCKRKYVRFEFLFWMKIYFLAAISDDRCERLCAVDAHALEIRARRPAAAFAANCSCFRAG